MMIPRSVLNRAFTHIDAGDDVAAVLLVCSWWNANARPGITDADHFGIYVGLQNGAYRNILPEDRTLIEEERLGPSIRAEGCKGTLFELRKSLVSPECRIASDLSGRPIESAPLHAGENIFQQWSARALRMLDRTSL